MINYVSDAAYYKNRCKPIRTLKCRSVNWLTNHILNSEMCIKFPSLLMRIITTKNTAISSNFLVWKFCGKSQFQHSFEWFARKYAETVPFHKTSAPRNWMILPYFPVNVAEELLSVHKSQILRTWVGDDWFSKGWEI